MTPAPKSLFNIKTLLEIILVLMIMITVKSVSDYFGINGAGSIGIWSGIIVASIIMKRPKEKWRNYGLILPKGIRDWAINIGLALLAVIVVFLVMGFVLDPILSHYGLEKPADVADRFQFFLGKPVYFILYLVTVVWIGAALGEELLMRGFLLNRLSDFFGKNKLGWFVSLVIHSTFFGILHSYQGLAGIITTAFIALIFGTMYLISKKRLLPVILAHMIINTISLTAFYLTGGAVN
ncbi:type II CAAX endopeptidase family protein [Roseivirga sp.]|uniref:CPBP family intramembrane glutamic endopeptidase n=1 Tax=Roseivirga sp. TaxID=1964215 RepID=UPI002B277C10|nr:type II CAAX endopeptidase family protein [Roseivirga sp.]